MQSALGYRMHTVVLPELASSAATIQHTLFPAVHDCEVHAIVIACATAVTGADTNTVHINIDEVDTSDSATERANYDLTSGNDITTAAKPYELFATEQMLVGGSAGSDTVITLSAGEYLRWEYEEIGTGLGSAIGAMSVTVVYKVINASERINLVAVT